MPVVLKGLSDDMKVSVNRAAVVKVSTDIVEAGERVGGLDNSLFRVSVTRIRHDDDMTGVSKHESGKSEKSAKGEEETIDTNKVDTINNNTNNGDVMDPADSPSQPQEQSDSGNSNSSDSVSPDTPSSVENSSDVSSTSSTDQTLEHGDAENASSASSHSESPSEGAVEAASWEDPLHISENFDIDELNKEFPVGSVVCTVRVFAQVTYRSEVSMDPNSEPQVKEDSLFHTLTFRGCISDQQELVWKVTEIY